MNTLKGFSIVETLIGLTLGAILCIAILGVYLAQKNIYKTNQSQAIIQDTESAIAALVTPAIRSAGFVGCTSIIRALSNLNPGGSSPLGSLNTNPTMIIGYDSKTNVIVPTNPANSDSATNWSPSLDTSLTGSVQAASDVLVVLGGTPSSQPIGVITFTPGSPSMVLQNTNGITAGQFAAISDCSKASVFLVTGVAGTTVTHASGTGALTNANSALLINYAPGSQFVPLTQTAFFIARDLSGQSALVRATLNSAGTWTIQSLAPGVDTMQVLYAIGSNGIPTQYVPASAVTDWSAVYAIRIGFLIEGQQGSETLAPTQYSVLGTTITVPADNRLRHVYEMTINLRNSAS